MAFSDVLKGASSYSQLIKNSSKAIEQVLNIPLAEIRPDPDQCRQEFNAGFQGATAESDEGSLTELIDSIKEYGVQNPIIVRPDPENPDGQSEGPKYMIVSGERRYRASLKANKTDIPAIIRTFANEIEIKVNQITENIQRVDLSAFEAALAIENIRQAFKKEKNEDLESKGIAEILGKSRYWVTMMDSFNNCPEELLPYFKNGKISSSARVGYELIMNWKNNNDLTRKWFNDAIDLYDQIGANAISDLKAYIKGINKKDVQELKSEQENSNAISYENNEYRKDTSEQLADEKEDLSTDTNNQLDDDIIDNNDTEDEYTELNEREHSARPAMSSGSGSSSAPTAGIGKPDYTDRDTRETYDPADHIDNDPDTTYEDDFSSDTEDESHEEQVAEIQNNSGSDDSVSESIITSNATDDHNVAIPVYGYYIDSLGNKHQCVFHFNKDAMVSGKEDTHIKVWDCETNKDKIVEIIDIAIEGFTPVNG